MPVATSFRTPVAALIFTATAIPNVAANASSSPITNIWLALHTADPTSGNQTTSEAGYTSYARVSVAREVSSFDEGLGDGEITNDAEIAFPSATGGSATVTYVSAGRDTSSTGLVFLAAALNNPVGVTTGIAPRFDVSALTVLIS